MFWLKLTLALAVTLFIFALPFWLIFGFSLAAALFISLAWLIMGAPTALILMVLAAMLGDAVRFLAALCRNSDGRQSRYPYGG